MSSFFLLLAAGAILGAILLRQQSSSFDLPRGGETTKETIVVEDGQMVGTQEELQKKEQDKGERDKTPLSRITKEIMITDGVKHSVPLEEILSGGPVKDGIPTIDNPKFVSLSEADDWLGDIEPGIAFSQGDTHRFYPYRIIV